jgi:hypothetical protein
MRILLSALCVLALGACGPSLAEQNPETVTDQSGTTFKWDCSKNNDCDLVRLGDVPPLPVCGDEDSTPGYSYSWGRFLEIYATCFFDGGWELSPPLGRITVCKDDSDCPQLVQYRDPYRFECRAGFCQSADHESFPPGALPKRREMLLLCYGSTPRSASAPTQLPSGLLAAVAEACPNESSPCVSIPEGCPDPRG